MNEIITSENTEGFGIWSPLPQSCGRPLYSGNQLSPTSPPWEAKWSLSQTPLQLGGWPNDQVLVHETKVEVCWGLSGQVFQWKRTEVTGIAFPFPVILALATDLASIAKAATMKS